MSHLVFIILILKLSEGKMFKCPHMLREGSSLADSHRAKRIQFSVHSWGSCQEYMELRVMK